MYELLVDFAVLTLVWRLRRVLRPDGALFLVYVVVYGVGRFLLTYYRLEKVWFWGLQEAQVIALVAVLVALPLLVWLWWSDRRSARTSVRRALGQLS